MTKRAAVIEFIEVVFPLIDKRECGTIDHPMRREAWNNFVDHLHREARITDWQMQNWGYPEALQDKTPWV